MDDALVLVTKLRQDADRLKAHLLGMSENERSARVYTEGTLWTVRSVLAHLMSVEEAFLILFQEIQQGGVGVSEEFSIDNFNAGEQARNERMSWGELLAGFETTRGRMIDFVSALTPRDLDKHGRHPYLGDASLREMVKMIYIHDQTHLRDIRKALGST